MRTPYVTYAHQETLTAKPADLICDRGTKGQLDRLLIGTVRWGGERKKQNMMGLVLVSM